ncbi:MAG: diacylglycerol kinase [Nitrosomonadales bacterium]|nr:diacylglycerol kinase [Nitrosomonadales bacterium]|tara:strand:+ start:308 stop:676 length:369 start_codon:yes stop_codon:yes gene_type:complete
MTSPFKGKTGLKRLINAFAYSLEGFKASYKNEAAFRQEFFLSIILIPAGFLIGETGIQKALLISSIIIITLVELLNTAIETTVDRISFENHHLAKRAKDIGSAAVFLAIANAFITWILILFF